MNGVMGREERTWQGRAGQGLGSIGEDQGLVMLMMELKALMGGVIGAVAYCTVGWSESDDDGGR